MPESNKIVPSSYLFRNKKNGKYLWLHPLTALVCLFLQVDGVLESEVPSEISEIYTTLENTCHLNGWNGINVQNNEKANELLNKYTNKKDTKKTYERGEVSEDWSLPGGVYVERSWFRKNTKKISAFCGIKKQLRELVPNDECSNFYNRFTFHLLNNKAKEVNVEYKGNNYDIGNDFSPISLFNNKDALNKVNQLIHNKVNQLIHMSCSGENTNDMIGTIFKDYLMDFFDDAGINTPEHEWLSYYKNYNILTEGKLTTVLSNGHIEAWRTKLLARNCVMGPDEFAYQFLIEKNGEWPSDEQNKFEDQKKKWQDYKKFLDDFMSKNTYTVEQKQSLQDYKKFLTDLLYDNGYQENSQEFKNMIDCLNRILENDEEFKQKFNEKEVKYNFDNRRFEMTRNGRQYDATLWLYYMCYKGITKKVQENGVNINDHKYDVFNVQDELSKYGGPDFKNKDKGCKSGFYLISQTEQYPLYKYKEIFYPNGIRGGDSDRGLRMAQNAHFYFDVKPSVKPMIEFTDNEKNEMVKYIHAGNGYDEKIFDLIKPKIRKFIDDNNLLDYENGEDAKIISGVSQIETIEHVNKFKDVLGSVEEYKEFIDKDFDFEQQEGEEQQQYIKRMDSIMQKMQRQMKIKVRTDNVIDQIKSELESYNGNLDCDKFIECVNSACGSQIKMTGDIDNDLKTTIANTRREFEQKQNNNNSNNTVKIYEDTAIMNMYRLAQDFMVAVLILARTCSREEKEQIILNMHEVESLIYKNPKALFSEDKSSDPVDNIIDWLFADTHFNGNDIYRKFVKQFVLTFHQIKVDHMTQFELYQPKKSGRKWGNGCLVKTDGKLIYGVPVQALENLIGVQLNDDIKKLDWININDECETELNMSDWEEIDPKYIEQEIARITGPSKYKLTLKIATFVSIFVLIIGMSLLSAFFLSLFGYLALSAKAIEFALIAGIASTVTSLVSLAIIGIVYKKNRNNEQLNINVAPISGTGENLTDIQNIQEIEQKQQSNTPNVEGKTCPQNEQTQT